MNPVSLRLVSGRLVGGVIIVCLVTGIRHLRGFWFSRELGGDQGEAGALAEGGPGVDGLGTVGRQHPSVLPDAACDGQAGLVPHGFCKCELGRKQRERFVCGEAAEEKSADWSFRMRSCQMCLKLSSIQVFYKTSCRAETKLMKETAHLSLI